MNNAKKVVWGLIISLFSCFILAAPLDVNAANYISDSVEKRHLFAVPGGGWSTITVEVTYTEKYTTGAYYNTFPERERCVLFRRAYATECPTVSVTSVRHSLNDYSKYFTSWEENTVMFSPTEWDGCEDESNYDSVTYSKTLDMKGKLSFMLSCEGAANPSAMYSVDLDLKID